MAVVPPAEAAFGLVETPEQVDEARVGDPLQGRTLFGADMYAARPFDRVVHIAVFRGDVEVTEHDQVLAPTEIAAEPVRQGSQPAELVGELVAAECLAVRYIEIEHREPCRLDRKHAALLVREPRQLGGEHGDRFARQHRDAVVGALASMDAVVAERRQIGGRKIRIGGLGLLQRDDVRGGRRGPFGQLRQADPQRVHVPGGDA